MGRSERISYLEEIERERESKIITYLTTDRQGVQAQIGHDVIPFFQKILNELGYQERIDLFLYSRGGNTITALEIVTLIREFCREFNVIIPFRAHSAATLIALGANNILMNKTAQLSPIDMTLTTPFNPQAPTPPGTPVEFLPIPVENILGYINFAKDQLKLRDSKDMLGILDILAKQVSPLAIGALYRAIEKNRFLAESLLRYHLDDEDKIDGIIDRLSKGYFTHSFAISRSEAKNMGLITITNTPNILEENIWQLYQEYEELLDLNRPYSPNEEYNNREENSNIVLVDFKRAIVEANIDGLKSFVFQTRKELQQISMQHPQFGSIPQIVEKDIVNRWIYLEDE